MFLVELDKVSFSYTHKIPYSCFFIKDLDLKIGRGEFISIIGPNGSGKSTLLKMLSGIIRPSSGQIMLRRKNYKDYSRKELARTISYVPQNTLTVFPFTVFEIVLMGRNPYMNYFGFEREDDIRIAERSLEQVGISSLRNEPVNEISGGEAQRAFIARALAQEPELILLDEPNTHLDLKHQISVFNLLAELNKTSQTTVIAVSHDLNLAGNFSRRIVIMNEGMIHSDDSTEKILTEENIRDLFQVNSKIISSDSGRQINILLQPNTDRV